MKTLFIYFSALLLPLMCQTASEEAGVAVSEPAQGEYVVGEVAAEGSASEQPIDNKSIEMPKELKIIKTGNLRYQVEDIEEESKKINQLTAKYKGYIQGENANNSTYDYSKNITVRIPHQNFDTFIADLSIGVAYFDQKNIQAQDVTEEFIDVEARLTTQKELEKRYLALLSQAKNIKDILEIEKELNTVRQDIESKEGRLKYLSNRVSWSTLDINIYKLQAESAHVSVSYFSKIWTAIKSGWNGLLHFFIGLLHIWPFILIFIFLFIFVRRKIRKKRPNDQT